ncbi:hypothetical protein [Ichthyenterobacterium magnum]|uniref:Trimeric autotransporter adhesin n=1 Tax=Ichthyenterobacterium magnum TaxID=1230530 RepID=A0A420DL48_9FLAO|nr:hypothetical protein [Ichthyenterobacterium magnum]RKE94897.1 trimeric autotransporter adhesin [Ichthyenterobacterium magnum]
MKTLYIAFFALLISFSVLAQNGINYKALIKDDNGNVIVYGNVDIEFSILENTTIIYKESQALLTDQNGIIITNIGNGIPISGTFNEIDWSKDNHFLNIKVDIGNGFTDLGTTQFMAVPYALNAKTANNVALEAINEGSGIGYRIIERNAADYGNIGLDAIDFSVSVLNSQDYGATGFRSIAAGSQTLASGLESLAIGIQTTASGDRSMASGNGTQATKESSVAMGQNTMASGNYAFATGQNTTASEESSTAMGSFSIASGKKSLAAGQTSIASGENAIALGKQATASGNNAFATGEQSKAQGVTSNALGNNVIAPSFTETAIGTFNEEYTPNNTTAFNVNDRLFTIGNGTSASNRSNALTVLKNGDIGVGITNPEARLDIRGGDWNLDAGNPGDFRIGNASHNFRIGIATGGGGAGITRMYTSSNDLIIGTSNSAVLKLDQNGELTAPSLTNTDIVNAGNQSVITKKYADDTYVKNATPIVREIMISGASFQPDDNNKPIPSELAGGPDLPAQNRYIFAQGIFYGVSDSGVYMTPVNLPVGSTITSISAYLYDNSVTNLEFKLKQKYLPTNFEFTFFTLTSNNSNSNQVLTYSTPIPILSNYSYYILIHPPSGQIWGNQGIKGVKISYTE